MTELDQALDLIGRGAEEILKREELEGSAQAGPPPANQGRFRPDRA